jgi:hypothetical protein
MIAMKSCRIHVMRASAQGHKAWPRVGRALADASAIPHHDTDDYFWRRGGRIGHPSVCLRGNQKPFTFAATNRR